MKTNPSTLKLLTLVAWASVSAIAAASTWIQPEGGSFAVSGNWDEGIPGEADWALFGANKTDPDQTHYTVVLDTDRTLQGLYLEGGDFEEVVLNLGGNKLSLTSSSTSDHALRVRGSSGGPAVRTLHLLNGELESGVARIGQISAGNLIVGAGTVWRVTEDTRIGNSTTGHVRVEGNGSIVTTGLLSIAAQSGSAGSLILDGPGASIRGTSNLLLGSGGEAYLELTNGATLDRSGHIHVGNTADSTGLMRVHHGASFTLTGSFRIGGRNDTGTAVGGEGHAIFASGAEASMARITMYSGNILEIDGAEVTSLNAGTTKNSWYAGGTYRIHLHGEEATPLTMDSVALAGTILDVRLGSGFEAELGNLYSIIDYSGEINGQFVSGESSVLGEGASIVVDGYTFALSYGNELNKVVSLELVAIPEPSQVAWFVVLACLGLWRCRATRAQA